MGLAIEHRELYSVFCDRSSLVAWWVKDLALSRLWLGFDPWPGNFCMPGAQPKKTLPNNNNEDRMKTINSRSNETLGH